MDLPLREAPAHPGSQVRVVPYDEGSPVHSPQRLAVQVVLDAPPGEPRHLIGRWATEWPTSVWNSAVVLGGDGRVTSAHVFALEEVTSQRVTWALFRVGEAETPLVAHDPTWEAPVVWRDSGLLCLDLTEGLGTVAWTDLADAVLELRATDAADPDRPPRQVHVPLTAR